MSMRPPAVSESLTPLEQLRYAREIILLEGHALAEMAGRLNGEFCVAVETMFACRGSVIATGMGKAGLIARKVAATLSSTGTRSHYLHPAEAVHGDLGCIHRDDLVLAFSQSGETEEVVRLLPSLTEFGVPLVAVVGRAASTLGRAARCAVEMGPLQEACALGLAPSTSTTAMLAIGDALALVVSRMRNFQPEDFARFHPAGNLGRRLSKVDDCMRVLVECRVADESQSVRRVFVEHGRQGRRSGAIMLVDTAGRLSGLFTDSDLARLLESKRDAAIDGPISQVMTPRPTTVPVGSMTLDAVEIMAQRKISELPVIDGDGRPRGMLDITDIVGLFPQLARAGAAGPSSVPLASRRPGGAPGRTDRGGQSAAGRECA